ncbi:MarR family winged helix-turn-helix transcriptional regulator [Streptomyces sp. NPDC059837]|uniref:MarR family winged helix-turn-helix transcriptional regulator n=1 Tax=Streptomyces sp. NPDC059837 TaxID=3346968 RepID=UPI00364AA391
MVPVRLARSTEGRLTMSAPADQIALTTSGITRLIDRIQTAGYVERCPCPTDRRVAFAAITDTGREVLDRAAVVHARNLRAAFGEFGEPDLTALDTLLDRLRKAASDIP